MAFKIAIGWAAPVVREPFPGWTVVSERAGDRASRVVRHGRESGELIAEVELIRSTWRVIVNGEPLQDGGEDLIATDLETAITEAELFIAALALDDEPPIEELDGW